MRSSGKTQTPLNLSQHSTCAVVKHGVAPSGCCIQWEHLTSRGKKGFDEIHRGPPRVTPAEGLGPHSLLTSEEEGWRRIPPTRTDRVEAAKEPS